MPVAKPPPARRRKSKKRPRKSNLGELIQLQQHGIARVADFWATMATRLAEGNFDPTTWLADYSKLWKGMADDLDVLVKASLPRKR